MDKHARLPFLGLLKVSVLGVAFPLLLTSHNWAQANTKQDNSLLYAQTPAQSTAQPSKSGEVKKINSPPQEKQQEEGEKSDDEKKQNLPWTVTVAMFGVVAILYLGVLKFYPLLLLRLPAELKIPKPITPVEFKLPLGFVIWLKYRPKVLDTWVEKHIRTFMDKFDKYETVSRRKNYVSLPVDLSVTKEHEQQELRADDLRKTFKKDKRLRLLIWGDGGTGKTTIACQIAQWAMANDKEKRLAEHLMLPVLIEQEPKSQSGEGIKALMEDIVGQIQELTDGEQKIVDELLVEQLLRQRRILLIVDRFSEMNSDTRDKINPKLRDFPANALVVTSRIEEGNIGEIDIKINTLPLDGVELTNFIKQYLKKNDKWKLFENDQQNFLKECAKLAGIVGDKKTIIVLLAKLYADRMVNAKENLRGTKHSPDNIPDLIVEYLKTLNSDAQRRTNQEYHTFEADAELIAWECVQQDYKPNYVDRGSIVTALGKEKADKILKYFEDELYLIKTGRSDTIRFALDTLAEYLAGLHLVKYHYKNDENKWNEFIKKVDPDENKRKESKGFLLAVRECCITKDQEKVPSFVADKLGELAGLDLEAEKQEKHKQRIDRFISDLSDSDLQLQSKLAAVKELQNMAATNQYALDGLVKALQIDDMTVCADAVAALGNLSNNSKQVLDELLTCLRTKKDDNVRTNVVVALGKLGNASKQVLNELLALLKDQDESGLHYNVVVALGKLKNDSKRVLDGLSARLEDADENSVVREAATEALELLKKLSNGT
ncbi:MAG: HEAT repeat domain-containing protein [Nostoc sp. S4]|nr:HEAT repeat domain-containing protein [Nostoc sp. S4]